MKIMANSPQIDTFIRQDEIEITPDLKQKIFFSLLEDMSGEKEKLAEQSKVNLSILEDINEAQEELKKKYAELDTLKDLVQELGSSLKTAIVLQTLIKALTKVLPESVIFAYAIPSPDPGSPSNLIYVYSSATLGEKYLNSVRDNIIFSFDSLPVIVKRREELAKWIRGKFIFEFTKGTQDNKDTKQPRSSFNVPFVVRDEVLGTINISSSELDLFTEKDINLVHTMVGATASTISRLRQLLESEQSRIASLVESLSNGVIMFDLDQRVTMSNPAAQKMTGLPEQGFYLSEFTKLFKENIDKRVAGILQKGGLFQIEEAILSRFIYEVFIVPVLDREKKIVGGAIILHDITHLKEIDQMKTDFVSIASHQLRTPLTTINWYTEMLRSGDAGKLNEKQKGFLEEVYKGSVRMVQLVNDLLNVSRIETGRLKIEPKPTDLVKFIASIIRGLEMWSKERNCVVVLEKPKKPLLKAAVDHVLMRQVVHNLITNAVRYSSSKKGEVTVTLEEKKENYLISVIDRGIGIPKEAQGRIFEKFFRADNARSKEGEGSGIGLYIAKMIMEAAQGKLWFESPTLKRKVNGKKEEYGTTFFVEIQKKGMTAHEGEKGLAI